MMKGTIKWDPVSRVLEGVGGDQNFSICFERKDP